MSGPAAVDALPLPPMDVASRLTRLRAALPDVGDALIVTNLANVRYLTGFSGSAGVLVVRESGATLVTDGRYTTQAGEEVAASGVGDVAVEVVRHEQRLAAVRAAVGRARSVALEAGHVTWQEQRAVAEAVAPAETVATTGLVETLRQAKDAGELARIERAAAIADAAFVEWCPRLVDLPTEREAAIELDHAMRLLGADDVSFQTIVASGSNGAKPHARPGDRRIRRGELVVVDFGALVDGYHSDMTRTVCIGEPSTVELSRVVAVVTEAQAAGVATVRSGVAARAVDAACRSVIDDAGWAERFVHGTGHGVGLDIHEQPSIGQTSTATLDAGFVVTVEPGVYLPEVGGARVEDLLVVTGDGCRPLSRAPKDCVIA